MKVFIVGSPRGAGAEGEAFREFCRELGQVLVQKGHQVILCSTSETTADRYVFEGVDRAAVNGKVVHFRLDQTQGDPGRRLKAESFLHALRSVDVDLRYVEGGQRVVHLRAIREADLIVSVGGSSGTAAAVYSAAVLEKPVMVVPSFGGASKDAWSDFRGFYNTDEKNLLQKSPQLSSNWTQEFIELAARFVRRNPMVEVRAAEVVASVATSVVLVGGWIAAFVRVNLGFLPPVAWTYVLIMIATYLGVLLRHSFSSAKYSWRHRVNDLFQALIIAFAVLIFAEGVNALVAGSGLLLAKGSDVQLLGWRLSIVGFSSGFLLDEYYKVIQAKARKFVT
ncbi:hypothetical protein M8542_04510 [Amycolatopsis sp. OK19-0408]|uniref:Uncharacterized protein n=1 Tax=Amycolatopsis iheyensis TaxID=2945988 RepID=A0A9X2SJA6_9PSEU|nr:hypothetical protein [Amycolatopsis iheyensis]MCR6482065.1 hypothetical protein [Amycolatopsis iheyensis]